MNFEMIAGLIRHILTFGGGFLVTGGYVADSDVQTGVGAIVTLVGIAWSFWAKKV